MRKMSVHFDKLCIFSDTQAEKFGNLYRATRDLYHATPAVIQGGIFIVPHLL
jgi:hypothetical protein